MPWSTAREAARTVGAALAARIAPAERVVADAVGAVLAEDLRALVDVPPADVAAMDGWAVAGPGPWTIVGRVLAGTLPDPLPPGSAVEIATGAWLPSGATAVVRRERGLLDGDRLSAAAPPGQDLRERGHEAQQGEVLVAAGRRITPPVLGLACAAGHDVLPVRAAPEVSLLVLGDELLGAGLPRDGRIRDALGPMVAACVAAYGGRLRVTERVGDSFPAVASAVAQAGGDVIVTTGGTAAGPVDHLHAVLAAAGASLGVNGVAVRPGHPMLLAVLPGERPLVGLPGNPLAAVAGMQTLLGPLLAAALRSYPPERRVRLASEARGHPTDTRLMPMRGGRPLARVGPAMLRGLVTADCLAVIPPGGAAAGAEVEILPVPWPVE